jgi:TrmH family RNA methyltransferase
MLRITSPQNPRVKDAARLRDRRQRDKQQRIIIDGAREIGRAMAAGIVPLELFVCPSLCASVEARRMLEQLHAVAAEAFEVSEEVFERLAFGQRTEGVLLIAAMPTRTLGSLALPDNPLVAVLEGVEKPGNAGAVLRSADGAGVDAVIFADPRTDLFNPNAIRASLGTIFSMPVCAASSADVLAWLRTHGMQVAAARVEAAGEYTQLDYRGATAIVLGSEADGLTALWSADDVRGVRLPMLGAADSLNVSAAAAVLFYEARRQRGRPARCAPGNRPSR